VARSDRFEPRSVRRRTLSPGIAAAWRRAFENPSDDREVDQLLRLLDRVPASDG
jgi:hypothetical protein